MNKVTNRDQDLINEITDHLELTETMFVYRESSLLSDEWSISWYEETECCDLRHTLTVYWDGGVRYTTSHSVEDYYYNIITLKRFLKVFL